TAPLGPEVHDDGHGAGDLEDLAERLVGRVDDHVDDAGRGSRSTICRRGRTVAERRQVDGAAKGSGRDLTHLITSTERRFWRAASRWICSVEPCAGTAKNNWNSYFVVTPLADSVTPVSALASGLSPKRMTASDDVGVTVSDSI